MAVCDFLCFLSATVCEIIDDLDEDLVGELCQRAHVCKNSRFYVQPCSFPVTFNDGRTDGRPDCLLCRSAPYEWCKKLGEKYLRCYLYLLIRVGFMQLL